MNDSNLIVNLCVINGVVLVIVCGFFYGVIRLLVTGRSIFEKRSEDDEKVLHMRGQR